MWTLEKLSDWPDDPTWMKQFATEAGAGWPADRGREEIREIERLITNCYVERKCKSDSGRRLSH